MDLSHVVFAPAHRRDGEAMQNLATAAYEVYVDRMGRQPAPMTSDYEALAETGHALLARIGDVLAGMLVTKREDNALAVDVIAVSPEFQGCGLGSELLAEAERLAAAAGLDSVCLYTNEAMTENITYYGRRGFIETHRAVDDGYRRVYFTKTLARPR